MYIALAGPVAIDGMRKEGIDGERRICRQIDTILINEMVSSIARKKSWTRGEIYPCKSKESKIGYTEKKEKAYEVRQFFSNTCEKFVSVGYFL